MGTILDCWHLKVNLKKNIIYMLTRLLKGFLKKPKHFLTEDFFYCHRCQRHLWCTLSCEYLREFLNKFKTVLNGILWGWGEIDSWKKPEVENLVTLLRLKKLRFLFRPKTFHFCQNSWILSHAPFILRTWNKLFCHQSTIQENLLFSNLYDFVRTFLYCIMCESHSATL
jgi:hypothetical protein